MAVAEQLNDSVGLDALVSGDATWNIHRSNLLNDGKVKTVYRYWPTDEVADHVEIAFTCHDAGVSVELQSDHFFMYSSELNLDRLREVLHENGLPEFPDVHEVVDKIRREFSAVTLV